MSGEKFKDIRHDGIQLFDAVPTHVDRVDLRFYTPASGRKHEAPICVDGWIKALQRQM